MFIPPRQPLPFCLRRMSLRCISTKAKSNGRPSVQVEPADRTSTKWSRVCVFAITGRTRIPAKCRRYSLSVPRHATSRKTKNVRSLVCVRRYTTKSTRNTSMTSLRAVRRWSRPATALPRFVRITIRRDVSPTIVSVIRFITLPPSWTATSKA